MTAKKNKETLQKANDEVTRGNNEGFLIYCTDDVQWTFVGDQTLTGKNEVRQYMKETYVTPPSFDVEEIIAEGDFVTVLGKISLKNKDGKTINYEYCDVWKFKDGLMAELKAFVIEKQ